MSPLAFANDDLGLIVEQQKIVFEVGKHADVHVKHIIETGKWGTDKPRIIEILPGPHFNLSVTDEDGDRLNFSYDGRTFEESKYIILNQKLGAYDLIAEYDLEDFMTLDNGKWKKEIKFGNDIEIRFDEGINVIFVNSRPIELNDGNGINCVGCFMTLEYFDDVKLITKEFSIDEKKFYIDIFSNEKISDINFIPEGNGLLNFNVDSVDQLFLLKMPLELFFNPFDVYFTEKDDTILDQIDKIRKSEFSQNEAYVMLSFRTDTEGVVSIEGATLEEHHKILEQIQKRTSAEVKSERIVEEKGISIPLPGQKDDSMIQDNENLISEKEELSFADELEKSTTGNSQDYTIFLVLIGIAAAIVVGIVVKIKKN